MSETATLKDRAAVIRELIKHRIVGKITPKHDVFGHHYKLPSGAVVDSISTKIVLKNDSYKEAAVREAAKTTARLITEGMDPEDAIKSATASSGENMRAAGAIGNIVHSVVEKYILEWIKKGKRPADISKFLPSDVQDEVVSGVLSAELFFREHKDDVVPIATELVVGSEQFKVAGTLDFLCFFKGKLTVIDWKTSYAVDDTYALQIAAYGKCFSEMIALPVESGVVVQLSKKRPQFSLYFAEPSMGVLWSAYAHLSAVYDLMYDGNPKMVAPKNVMTLS